MAKACFELFNKIIVNRKNCILSIVIMTMAVLCNSCVTYGRENITPVTPVEGRCLLELSPSLNQSVSYMIGNASKNSARNVVSIPAGHHELNFYYEKRRTTGSYTSYDGNYRTTTTNYDVSSANGVPLSYTFEAGHHYYVTGVEEDGMVHIEVEDLGTSTGLYHNGVYTGGMFEYGAHLGSGGLSHITLGFGMGYTVVIDFGTPVMLGLHTGMDAGFVGDMSLGAFGGLFGHFYIPNTNIGIGGGYGYRAEMGIASDSFYSPFIRGELLWKRLGVYFEYYTNPDYLEFFSTSTQGDVSINKQWGIGLFARM